jgi:pimeloyl-ACP methyl ester carboxylesterase
MVYKKFVAIFFVILMFSAVSIFTCGASDQILSGNVLAHKTGNQINLNNSAANENVNAMNETRSIDIIDNSSKINFKSSKWVDVVDSKNATIIYQCTNSTGNINPQIKDSKGSIIGYLPSVPCNGVTNSFTWDGKINNITVNQADNPFTITLILKNSEGNEITRSNEQQIFVGRPVILVHGGLSTASELKSTPTYKELSKDHYVVSVEYLPEDLQYEGGATMGDIRTYAENLKETINSNINKTGARKVDIVAHSMGGLVSRQYIQDTGNYSHVGKLIMVGTPNRGTYLPFYTTVFIPTNFCKIFICTHTNIALYQMFTGSGFLNKLNSKAEDRKNYYTLASNDHITSCILWFEYGDGVVPYDNAILANANIRLIHSLHWNHIKDKTVIKETSDILQSNDQ